MPSTLDPLVSIVSPVYNVAPYLRESIESVLSQTYQNWEYILVNNCSSDATLTIAEEYSARHPRIRVCSNARFVRVQENYNIALREISPESKYCKVLAGDDWMYPECLEKMVDVFERHPRVVIVGAYSARGLSVVWTGLPSSVTALPGRDVCRSNLRDGLYVFGTPSSVLYRSDIVRRRYAFFNESNIHADAEVCWEFLEDADFGFVHQILTYLRLRDDSVSTMSDRMNTRSSWRLFLLDNYGPKYLDRAELQSHIRKQLADYYRYLGKEVFLWRNAEFWTLHTRKLAELGRPLSFGRLAVAAAGVACDGLLNPKRSAAALIRYLSRRLRPEAASSSRVPRGGKDGQRNAHNARPR